MRSLLESDNACRPRIICGLHRSGTTFVGEILRRAGVCVVHEPLNERFGMLGVPIAYPFVEKRSDYYSVLLDDAVAFARPWNKNADFVRAKGLRRKLYGVTGGRAGLCWDWLRFRQVIGMPNSQIFLKDPFMSLATPWLVRHHGLRVLCMVRHPAAIHYSTEKMNWCFDIENLFSQSELIDRYGRDIPEAHWDSARKHGAASIALLWKLMVRINSALAQNDERMLVITHETLCLDPLDTASNICRHFGISFTPALERFVVEHSEGDRSEAKSGRAHDFKRNSQAIPNIWQGKLSTEEEQLIVDIAGEEILKLYGRA